MRVTYILRFSASVVVLCCLLACKADRDVTSKNKLLLDSLATKESAKVEKTKLTRQMPEYYGVFYIGPDSLIEMRQGNDRDVRVYTRSPQFYVYGRAAIEIPFKYMGSDGRAGWQYFTRVYPIKNSAGDMVLRVQLPSGGELPPNKYWLFGGDYIEDRYNFTVVDSPPSPRKG